MERIELDFATGPRDARVAREALVGLIEGKLSTIVMSDAMLLTSELVSNMSQHAPGRGHMRVTLADGVLRVEVSDASPILPVMARRDSMIIGGHGLRLVDAIAYRWGFEPTDAGKTVWFELVA